MGRERGFTLIELMVALAVGSLVVVAAHRIVTGVIDGVHQLEGAREWLDREANARRLLAALAGSIEVGGGGSGFAGAPDRMAFTAWCSDSLGHHVRRRIAISVQAGALSLEGLWPDPVRLLDDVRDLALDYLPDLGAEQRFVRVWESDASAPAAIRLRLDRGTASDTLLLLVGPRG
jgi:prepilin-type N-terminal cleavage/methylation domain-containing protein